MKMMCMGLFVTVVACSYEGGILPMIVGSAVGVVMMFMGVIQTHEA